MANLRVGVHRTQRPLVKGLARSRKIRNPVIYGMVSYMRKYNTTGYLIICLQQTLFSTKLYYVCQVTSGVECLTAKLFC